MKLKKKQIESIISHIGLEKFNQLIDVKDSSKKEKKLREWEARQRRNKRAPRDYCPPYDPKPN